MTENSNKCGPALVWCGQSPLPEVCQRDDSSDDDGHNRTQEKKEEKKKQC